MIALIARIALGVADPGVGVRLVNDDVFEVLEELGVLGVAGQHGHVQQVRVTQHHMCPFTQPRERKSTEVDATFINTEITNVREGVGKCEQTEGFESRRKGRELL